MVSFSKTPVALSPAGLTYVRSGRLAIARPGYSCHPRRHSAYRKTVVAADAPNAVRADTTQTLEHQARSYLDINCGHCHNANGAADTSGLLLDYKIHLAKRHGCLQSAYRCRARLWRALVQHRTKADRRFDLELSAGHQGSWHNDARAWPLPNS